MEDRIHVIVLTPAGKKLDKMVSYVSIPGEEGALGILAGHLPLMCSIKSGELKCRFGADEEISLRIFEGVAHVNHNNIDILVSHVEEI